MTHFIPHQSGIDNRQDNDGDQLFIVIEKKGKPTFRNIDLVREPSSITEEDIELLFKKSNRVDRTDLSSWLPNYFDDVPIGQATYAIRWMLYSQLRRFKTSDHPMAEAWKEIAPKAIDMIEFVMDIRKGDYSDSEIERRMAYIDSKIKEIRKAQEDGNWFAKTVTSGSLKDVPGFIMRFKSLQEFIEHITEQQPSLATLLS